MQYFPTEARLDKMFFPYYGKKAHVRANWCTVFLLLLYHHILLLRYIWLCCPPLDSVWPLCMYVASSLHVYRASTCSQSLQCSSCWQRRISTLSRRWSVKSRAQTCATMTTGTSSWAGLLSGSKCRSKRTYQLPRRAQAGFNWKWYLQFQTLCNSDLI